MSSWKTLESEIVYETPWIKVHRDEVLNHHKKSLTYSYVKLQHPSVFVVAVNESGQLLIQKNYRYTIDRTMWEFPAGYSEGQDLLEAAKRELLEETGFASTVWTNLGTLYQASGIGSIPFTVFLAQKITKETAQQELDEEITEQQFIDFSQADAMIARGEFAESAHIASIYLAKLYLSKGGNNGRTNNRSHRAHDSHPGAHLV